MELRVAGSNPAKHTSAYSSVGRAVVLTPNGLWLKIEGSKALDD